MPLPDLIAAAGERLTPAERRIARAVLEDPTLPAFGTVSDLASKAGTSRPTIVRFATKLGFEGYSDLQRKVREGLSEQLLRPSQRIRQQPSSKVPALDALGEALASVRGALSDGRLQSFAEPIARARQVWIITGETSRAGAHALNSGLSMIRASVRLLDEHSSGRDLGSAAGGDVAVVFDFARYRRFSITTARALAEADVNIVAITDGPLSPLAAITDNWCALKIPAIGPFDSSLPAVATAEILVALVATELEGEARDRIDRTEALWEATNTFM